MNNQPFFRVYPLTIWNIVTIVAYTITSLGLLFYYLFTSHPKDIFLFFYIFATQFGLYLGQYRAIRNLYVYIYWCLVGIIHLLIPYYIANNPALNGLCGFTANTILVVILLQVLRFASLTLQGKELVAIDKSGFDMFDKRKITWIDRLLFFIYFVSWFLGIAIFSKYFANQ